MKIGFLSVFYFIALLSGIGNAVALYDNGFNSGVLGWTVSSMFFFDCFLQEIIKKNT